MKRAAVYFRNGIGNFVMLTPFLRALYDLGLEVDLLLTRNDAYAGRSVALLEFARAYEGDLVSRVVDVAQEEVAELEGYDELVAFSHGEDSPMRRELWREGARGQGKPIRDWIDHEVLYYLGTAYEMGYRGTPGPLELPDVKATLLERPFAVFCNGSQTGPRWSRKRWLPERFAELAWVLRRWSGLEVVLLGGASELEDHATIAEAGSWVHDLTGKTSLLDTASYLRGAQLCVTTDTATQHLAAAADCPSVVLFGPTVQRKNRPWGDPAGTRSEDLFETVELELECRPCQYLAAWDQCDEPRCMRELEVGDVMNAVRRLQRRLGARAEAA